MRWFLMSTTGEKIIHVLTGPTAVGKTALSLAWAEAFGAEIVSCDSLLFYRGMDIGTAKPSAAEQSRVPHHLIDVCAVTERMDVTEYVRAARAAVEGIVARGRRVLVAGGSGFYLKAFFGPVADDVLVPAELRAEIAARLEREGLAALLAELRRLNPGGLGNLDTANPRRVVRALERCRASGKPLDVLAAEFARRPGAFADYRVKLVRLDRAPAELEARIEARVRAMIAEGLVDEVRRLRAAGLERNPSAAGAIGYRETLAFLQGRLSRENLVAEIARNTRGLVKKQRTWFRTQLPEQRVVDAATAVAGRLFAEG
jgi:tRNA dimethylallyltransferase